MAFVRPLSDDDVLKLKAAILYILDKCGVIDYFHLFKILYFADREHYAVYGRRIIKDTFCAFPNGPVPSFTYDAVKEVLNKSHFEDERLKCISGVLESCDPTYSYYLKAKEQPDLDELSKSDIEMLDKSIDENMVLPFGPLSRKSHDLAWQDAWNRCVASEMDPLLMARAAGATDETLDFIRENEMIDSLIN